MKYLTSCWIQTGWNLAKQLRKKDVDTGRLKQKSYWRNIRVEERVVPEKNKVIESAIESYLLLFVLKWDLSHGEFYKHIKIFTKMTSSLTFAICACWIVVICCATTDSTSMSIRLNSSKQAQAPELKTQSYWIYEGSFINYNAGQELLVED